MKRPLPIMLLCLMFLLFASCGTAKSSSTTTPSAASTPPSVSPTPTFTPSVSPSPPASPTPTSSAAAVATVAFMRYKTNEWEERIFLVNCDGTGLRQLTLESDVRESYPKISPDGRKIVFGRRTRNTSADIYVMNPDGSGRIRLTDNPNHDDTPSWSPDGKQIAFMSMRDGNMEIYVMNSDGSGQKRLTSDPAWDLLPAWSPDGTKIAFLSLRGDVYRWWVMNANGSDQHLMADIKVAEKDTKAPVMLLQGTWGHLSYSQGLFFAPVITSEKECVISIKVDEGKAGFLTYGDALNVLEAPDGSVVATLRSKENQSLDLSLVFPTRQLTSGPDWDIAGSCAVIRP